MFGIWNEETDWLPEGQSRRVVTTPGGLALGLDERYAAQHACAIIHLRGAEALAVYDEDFFSGTPALTVKRHGAGAAYYQATHLGPEYLGTFYDGLVSQLEIPRALGAPLPPDVHVQRRSGPESEFLFVQNFSRETRELRLPGHGYVDRLAGAPVPGTLALPPWGSTVLARPRRS